MALVQYLVYIAGEECDGVGVRGVILRCSLSLVITHTKRIARHEIAIRLIFVVLNSNFQFLCSSGISSIVITN